MIEDLLFDIRRLTNQVDYIILVIKLNSYVLNSEKGEMIRSTRLYKAIMDCYQELALVLTH